MLFSNSRKLCLCGWLQEYNRVVYCSPLRLQKFLFFYEIFSKVLDDNPDFDRLKGYINGPVFSTVFGDYGNDQNEFNTTTLDQYRESQKSVDTTRAKRASFIACSLSEYELSLLTHQFNIWNSKKDRIMAGEQQVELYESDFNQNDIKIARTLETMYPDTLLDNSVVIPMGVKNFVFSCGDAKKLTEQHYDTMSSLIEKTKLQNPIFTEIDEGGRLVID